MAAIPRWFAYLALSALALGGLALAYSARPAPAPAPPAGPEHAMAPKWNPAAATPPIDAAQPAQQRTATFAVG
jgi:hypothetical protein